MGKQVINRKIRSLWCKFYHTRGQSIWIVAVQLFYSGCCYCCFLFFVGVVLKTLQSFDARPLIFSLTYNQVFSWNTTSVYLFFTCYVIGYGYMLSMLYELSCIFVELAGAALKFNTKKKHFRLPWIKIKALSVNIPLLKFSFVAFPQL